MSFTPIIQALKGSARSGNFAHAGRPGMLGGSKTGGGHGAIKVDVNTPTDQIRHNAVIARNQRDFKPSGKLSEGYFHYQNIHNLPGMAEVKKYTGGDYYGINGCLRGTTPPYINCDKIKNDTITGMDKFFDALPPLKDNIIVRRGSESKIFDGINPGDEFIDKGFVSTSRGSGMGVVRLEIHVPNPGEEEILLNRNARFKILSVVRSESGEVRRITAEYINDARTKTRKQKTT